MSQRRQQMGYNGSSAYYGGSYQPASFMDSVGNFFGNLGNSWQGGSDAPMYGANPEGLPFATSSGAYVAGEAAAGAAADVATAVLAPVTGFAVGVAQRAGVVIGAGIIIYTLLKSNRR